MHLWCKTSPHLNSHTHEVNIFVRDHHRTPSSRVYGPSADKTKPIKVSHMYWWTQALSKGCTIHTHDKQKQSANNLNFNSNEAAGVQPIKTFRASRFIPTPPARITNNARKIRTQIFYRSTCWNARGEQQKSEKFAMICARCGCAVDTRAATVTCWTCYAVGVEQINTLIC